MCPGYPSHIQDWVAKRSQIMIIWGGHGVLIPIFGIIGMLGGGFLAGAIGGAVTKGDTNAMVGMSSIGSGIGAAAMLWLYALTLGKTKDLRLLDPATGRPVILRK